MNPRARLLYQALWRLHRDIFATYCEMVAALGVGQRRKKKHR